MIDEGIRVRAVCDECGDTALYEARNRYEPPKGWVQREKQTLHVGVILLDLCPTCAAKETPCAYSE